MSEWLDFADPADPSLVKLATDYGIEPDWVRPAERPVLLTSLDEEREYLRIRIPVARRESADNVTLSPFTIYLAQDWVITVHGADAAISRMLIEPLRSTDWGPRTDELLRRLLQAIFLGYETAYAHGSAQGSRQGQNLLRRGRGLLRQLSHSESRVLRKDRRHRWRQLDDQLNMSLQALSAQVQEAARVRHARAERAANSRNRLLLSLNVLAGAILLLEMLRFFRA